MKKEKEQLMSHCIRCGKHVDELEPFQYEDSIIPFICGNKLVKNHRMVELVERCEVCEEILRRLANGNEKSELIRLYGKKDVEAAIEYEEYIGCVEASWECRECINEEGPYKHYLQNTN